MICYFDTSAFVPLLVSEPGSARAARLWQSADRTAASELLYVEAAAALAQAWRLNRLDDDAHREASAQLDDLYAGLHLIPVEQRLIRRAAVLAVELELRGYDAVHCAAAERLVDDDLVVAAGDAALLRACRQLGLTTSDTSQA